MGHSTNSFNLFAPYCIVLFFLYDKNYCSHANFSRVWRQTRTGRRKMAQKWRRLLAEHYPHLAKQSEDIDKNDNFTFEEEEEKHRRKKEAKKKK